MAKERKNNTAVSALTAVTNAIRLETSRIAGQTVDMKEYLATINLAMDVVEDSNIMTAMENLDDSVELQHQIAADLEAQLTAEGAAERAAEQEKTEQEKTEQEEAQEQETEQGEQEQGTEEKTEQEQAQEQETKPLDSIDLRLEEAQEQKTKTAKIAGKTDDIPF